MVVTGSPSPLSLEGRSSLSQRDTRCGSFDLSEHRRDVDAPVRRRVRAEPARRFLQLPLGPRPVAARRVVPRHGDVDEALEEVPLRSRRLAPFVLERLVGVEPALRAHQLNPTLETHAKVP